MTHQDHQGLAVTGANDTAIAHYEDVIAQFQCYSGDPVAAVEQAIEQAPDFAMAHILRAYLFITGTDARGLDDIAASRSALETPPRNRQSRQSGLVGGTKCTGRHGPRSRRNPTGPAPDHEPASGRAVRTRT